MKTAIAIGGPASGRASEFAQLAAFAVEAEKLGVDSAWSAEAWGYDAVSILAYLAAKTERLVLGSGILLCEYPAACPDRRRARGAPHAAGAEPIATFAQRIASPGSVAEAGGSVGRRAEGPRRPPIRAATSWL